MGKFSMRAPGTPSRNKKINPIEFYRDRVLPCLGDELDSAFPEFQFRKGSGEWWIARSAPTGYEEYDARGGRLTANSNGFRSFKTGKKFISWLEYVGGISKPRGADFTRAVIELANRVNLDTDGLESNYTPPEQDKEFEERLGQQDLLETFAALAQAALQGTAGNPAQDYLIKDRGFTTADLQSLPLGYFTSKAEVVRQLLEAGFPQADQEASGLFRDGRWEGRIVCPCRDLKGHIVTFWARDIDGKSNDNDKYLKLKGSPEGWARPQADLILFNLNSAIRSKETFSNLVIVEGVLDPLLLTMKGMANVAALGGDGSNMSAQKWEALAALGIQQVTLALDNDLKKDGSWPGLEGTRAALKNLLKAKAAPAVFILHPKALGKAKDPDQFVRENGIEAFKNLVANDPANSKRIHAFTFLAQEIIAQCKIGNEWTDTGRQRAIDEAIELDQGLPEEKAVDLIYLWNVIEKETGVPLEALTLRLESIKKEKAKKAEKAALENLAQAVTKLTAAGKLDEAQALLLKQAELIRSEQINREIKPVQNVADSLKQHEQYLEAFRGKEWIGLPTKILHTLDEKLLGLRGLIALGGPPNTGKTCLAVQLAVDAIIANEDAVLVFASLEMSTNEMLTRLLSALAELHYKTILMGSKRGRATNREANWSPKELEAIEVAKEKLKEIGNRIRILDFDNCPMVDVPIILKNVSEMKEQTGATRAIVLVDYMQIMPIPETEASRLRTELDQDKWRVGNMKEIRDCLKTEDDPMPCVIAISEARKPGGGSGESWGGGMADLMGSARAGYCPDCVIMLRPLPDSDLAFVYNWKPPNQQKNNKGSGNKTSDTTEQNDGGSIAKKDEAALKRWAKIQREGLSIFGLSPLILDILKGRDGMERGEIEVLFWYRQSRLREMPDLAKKLPNLVKRLNNEEDLQAFKAQMLSGTTPDDSDEEAAKF